MPLFCYNCIEYVGKRAKYSLPGWPESANVQTARFYY